MNAWLAIGLLAGWVARAYDLVAIGCSSRHRHGEWILIQHDLASMASMARLARCRASSSTLRASTRSIESINQSISNQVELIQGL